VGRFKVGELRLESGRWFLKAEPYVLLMFKRLFEQVKKQYATVSVKDTPEVCADLRWFMQRYDLLLTQSDWEYLHRQAEGHEQDISDWGALLAGAIDPRAFTLALPPRDYQSLAADLAVRTRGMILGDELGLGKTIVGLCVASLRDARPALVCTLTHLPQQWEAEVKRFLPEAWVHVVKRMKPYDVTTPGVSGAFHVPKADLSGRTPFPDVLIVPYSKLRGWSGFLARVCRSAIFDECQELRRDESQRYLAAEHVARQMNYVLGLSATPVFNYGIEMWNILNVIRPERLGDKDEFKREWCLRYHDKGKVRDPQALGSYLRAQGLYLRRTREDVGRELPPLTIVAHNTPTDPKALDDIATVAGELARIIVNEDKAGRERGEQWRAAGQLDWKLRQATGIAKAPYVADFVRLLVESGERVLLYGWHHAVFDIWQSKMEDLEPAFYTGRESATQKAESARRFIAKETDVLVMSLRAGQGLDGLQHADCRVVVVGELDWSPAIHRQGVGRIYRDGQAKKVSAYLMVAEDGADPIIAGVLGVKKQQAQGVLDPEGVDITPLTDTDRVRKLAEAYLAREKGLQKRKTGRPPAQRSMLPASNPDA
jgi:superfamily II DNA or RNA helicase